MVDLLGAGASITASDFTFRMGNNNSPGQWAVAPTPATVTVRSVAGVGGSDRVELIWPAGQIAQTWLEVTVAANSHTRLAQPDVFYFGNAVGDSGMGDTVTNALVTGVDESGPRNNPQFLFNNIPITNIYDYNRDGSVSSVDESVARTHPTNPITAVKYINIGAPPSAPEGEPLVVALAAVSEPTEKASGNDEGGALTSAIALAACQPAEFPIAVRASFYDRSHDVGTDSVQSGVAVRGATPAGAAIALAAPDRLALLNDEFEYSTLELDELLDALVDATGRKR